MSRTRPHVWLPQEWLARQLDRVSAPAAAAGQWRLLGHCTERTNAAAAIADWVRVFRHFGVDVETAASGHCGMSGLYGHERRNRAASDAIYNLSWARLVSDPQNARRLLATGDSCRCQAAHMSGVQLLHPVQCCFGSSGRPVGRSLSHPILSVATAERCEEP